IVRRYIPVGTGHTIITSRVTTWIRALRADGIEIAEFTPEEAVEFLRKRVNQFALMEYPFGADKVGHAEVRATDAEHEAKAGRLAQTLAYLPIAAEHAAAYLNETGISVDQYLALFEENALKLFSSYVDMSYPVAVGTTW